MTLLQCDRSLSLGLKRYCLSQIYNYILLTFCIPTYCAYSTFSSKNQIAMLPQKLIVCLMYAELCPVHDTNSVLLFLYGYPSLKSGYGPVHTSCRKNYSSAQTKTNVSYGRQQLMLILNDLATIQHCSVHAAQSHHYIRSLIPSRPAHVELKGYILCMCIDGGLYNRNIYTTIYIIIYIASMVIDFHLTELIELIIHARSISTHS